MKLLLRDTIFHFTCLMIVIIFFTFCGLDKTAQQIEKQESESTTTIEKNDEKEISFKKGYEHLLIKDTTKTYDQTVKEVQKLKKSIEIEKIGLDSISTLFSDLLVKRIIPYWYGTGWSFEGHTSIPQKGTIACGYFISTTLEHVGLNLNRYKLAQQSPINEAKSLSMGTKIYEIIEGTPEDCISTMRGLKLKDGLYFLGFDAGHVGYLYKESEEFFVIHSNFFGIDGVRIEKIETSEAFLLFNRFYITKISSNEKLLGKWLNEEEIRIVTR